MAGGLRDRLGGRMVRPGAAALMDRIEHNREATEGGLGSQKVTRSGPKTTCLRFGRETFRSGKGSYVLIPANNRYFNLLNTPTDFSIEFHIDFSELPPANSDPRTLICHGAPYTAGILSWELNYIKDPTSGEILLQLAWRDDGTFSGSNNIQAKAWTKLFYLRTTYQIRVTFDFNAGATPDDFELFVDNVSQGTIDNQITTKRPITAVNA
ncbi:MAG: hypothetical protein MJA83_07620, partial [Gammaproteobacteria bacterium]|nr:hypothetical protein [Gammaproteobacteria bacterium]